MNRYFKWDRVTDEISETDSSAMIFAFAKTGDRIVQQDKVGRFFISTVFLVLDHSYTETPLIFETMVFEKRWFQKMSKDVYMKRYSTPPAARIGHRETVQTYKNKLLFKGLL